MSSVLTALLLGVAPRLGAAELESKPLAGANDARLAEADRWDGQVAQLYQAGRWAEAIGPAQAALSLREEVLGPDHPDTAVSLNNLAGMYRATGAYTNAEPLFQRALRIFETALGAEHSETATALNNLAGLYEAEGDYTKAKPLYTRALAIREKTAGPESPDTAGVLGNLALLYMEMADYAQAEPLIRRALAIREKALGPDDPETAASLDHLAGLYGETGDYAQAEPLCRRALEIRERALGPEHPDTAASLSNLAELYRAMRDDAQAEPLFLRALDLREKGLGPEHPDTAMSLNNLAALHADLGEYAQAESLYQRALKITEAVLGAEHPDTAISLNNLAALYSDMGEYAKAEPLCQRALKITEARLGAEHSDTAISLSNLAALEAAKGDLAKAEPLHARALAITEKALGPDHARTAICLGNLAMVYAAGRKDLKAEPLLRRAVDIRARTLDQAAAIQSERQQLAILRLSRGDLHAWLSVAPRAGLTAEAMAARVFLSKGQIAARQASLRRLRTALEQADDQTALALFSAWEDTSRQLAALATVSGATGPAGEGRWRRLDDLSREEERLERELAARSAVYRQAEARSNPTLAELRQLLSRWPDTALVDLLEYTHSRAAEPAQGRLDRETRVLAFVWRGDTEEVRRIELGAAPPILEAMATWRASLGASAASQAAGRTLRESVWLKLESALAGVKTVLLSPDGALSQMPWGALPGREPGRFLIEEYAIGVVPVPRLLPELVAPAERRTDAPPSLLVLGEVDYGGDPGVMVAAVSRSAARRSGARGGPRWEELRGTRDEVLAVQDSFRQRFEGGAVKELRRQRATEAAFREAASAHRYLHVATHGFFAQRGEERDADGLLRSEPRAWGDLGLASAAGWPPGLLTGLVLAGANRPVDQGKDDGILTALEVQALDLRGVELAVLSACETGLGESVAGEGVLGLQRAFQLAGARTTVGSLWKVPDEATRGLMSEFYRRLWEQGQGKLEALREAQLWMLREGKARGVRVEEPDATATEKRLPPKYWAAFVLSGDWR